MNLREIQERMFRAITEPLTASEHTRSRGLDGRSMRKEAEAIIKPNDRLTSLERLEIYNRQYWFRVLGSLIDDFPGLQAILGERRFEKLSQAYLQACPSRSHTLRDLGGRLETWLKKNPEHAGRHLQLALDMVRLEWANIESFDAEERPPVTEDELLAFGQDASGLRLHLQPYLKIVAVSYPVDDIRIAVKDGVTWTPSASNAVQSSRGKAVKHSFAGLKPEPIHIAVHRQANTIYYKRIDSEGQRMLAALGRGRSLLQAIESAFRGSSIPAADRAEYVRDSFANWTALGWFHAG
ncbi:putative DNA-binding domain-containing protein [Verrucomicrobiaceae bacterium R5-34]|nr:putative DNA-binding domain-containing protein [Verrucomicrobiaceae bacterium R5-34]